MAPLGTNTFALAAKEASDILPAADDDDALLLLVMLRLLAAFEGVGVEVDAVAGVNAVALGVKAEELAVRLDDGVDGLDDVGVDVPRLPCISYNTSTSAIRLTAQCYVGHGNAPPHHGRRRNLFPRIYSCRRLRYSCIAYWMWDLLYSWIACCRQ